MIIELAVVGGLLYFAHKAKKPRGIDVKGHIGPGGVLGGGFIGGGHDAPPPRGFHWDNSTGVWKLVADSTGINIKFPPEPPMPAPPKYSPTVGSIDASSGRIGQSSSVIHSGGGGPENAGAQARQSVRTALPPSQPSWHFESDREYFGHARPSTVPVTAGGGNGQPSDAFRWLGDHFGGRG